MFLQRYSDVHVALDLANQPVDLLAEGIDVAIRLAHYRIPAWSRGSLEGWSAISARRRLTWSDEGAPHSPEDINDTVERPSPDGRPRQWRFSKQDKTVIVDPKPRISVNEILTIHPLVLGGAGPGNF
jgi:DNA-binding transcriptional LysR family regulator